jgi:hypothetical protein
MTPLLPCAGNGRLRSTLRALRPATTAPPAVARPVAAGDAGEPERLSPVVKCAIFGAVIT